MISSLKLLKNFMNIDKQNSSEEDDVVLYRVLSGADKAAKEYCNRDFESTTYADKYYNGNGSENLVLDDYPIISIASLYSDPSRTFGSDSLLTTDDYLVDENSGIITLLDGLLFSSLPKTIKITYTAGYASLPGDLIIAVNQLAAADYIETKTKTNVVGGNNILYQPEELRKSAYKTLKRYRRMSV